MTASVEGEGETPTIAPADSPLAQVELADGDPIPNGYIVDTRDAVVVVTHLDGSVATLFPATLALLLERPIPVGEGGEGDELGGTQLFLGEGDISITAEDPESVYEIVTDEGAIVIEGSTVAASCRANSETEVRRCWTILAEGSAAHDPNARITSNCLRRSLSGTCWESIVQTVVPGPSGSSVAHPEVSLAPAASIYRSSAGWLTTAAGSNPYTRLAQQPGHARIPVNIWTDLATSQRVETGSYTVDVDGVYEVRTNVDLDKTVVNRGDTLRLTISHQLTGPSYVFRNSDGLGFIQCDLAAGLLVDAPTLEGADVGFVPHTNRSPLDLSLDSAANAPFSLRATTRTDEGDWVSEGCAMTVTVTGTKSLQVDLPPGVYRVVPQSWRRPWATINQEDYNFTLTEGTPPVLVVQP